MAEKMRVHILAKELSVPSKVIVEKCKAEGIDSIKNHMSTLSAGLHATILEWFSEGSQTSAVETAKKVDLKTVRVKRKTAAPKVEVVEAAPPEAPPADGVVSATATADAAPVEADIDATVAAEAPIVDAPTSPDATESPDLAAAADEPTTDVQGSIAAAAADAETPDVTAEAVEASSEAAAPVTPAGPQNVPAKAKLTGPRVVRYEAPDYDTSIRRRRPAPARPAAEAPGQPTGPSPVTPAGRGGGAGDKAAAKKKTRGSARQGAARLADSGAKLAEWRDRDLEERKARLAGATGRRTLRRRSTPSGGGPGSFEAQPKTEATVNEPVRVKDFCSATGLNFMQLSRVLKDEHNMAANVNMTLPTDTAELLALHFGIELTVIPAKTLLDELEEQFQAKERKNLQHRPPVVTMLGHVDHGKTSLLDAIRNSRVASGEDGGITQHIGAHHIETAHGTVTFLDTPGHQAFTAMRARGAHMTDVVVLVVAADDGLMPQTIEAINHAKAAGVPVVVALNKIDLGDQNTVKIYGQLSEHGLTPSGDWGGEVDVMPTSATKNTGITELVEHLAELSTLLDLKADPALPAKGSVVEAETKTGVGSVARVLIQEGTLRVGSFVVCGPAFGKVRALLDDRGNRIKEAGPSIPVEVWGLDEVPAAGDRLYQVESLQRGKSIAAEVKHTRVQESRTNVRRMTTLEEMFLRRDTEGTPELNLIVKADVDGSIAAIKQVLSDFPSDEVRLTIRHSGVGAVNESDVLLASTCKGIVVAFRADVSPAVRRIADRHGVEIRPYRVIYDLHDDVKKSLEGLLAPDERIESRATSEVREVFRLSKKGGVIAGSLVTEGTMDRSHFAKVVRNGTVVREKCKIASLRRFKDDVKQVRSGMECGIRLEGFDDIHAGDIVETFEIVEVARTL